MTRTRVHQIFDRIRFWQQGGNPLIQQQSRAYLPSGAFLAWHEKEVLKRPQRVL